MQDEAEARYWEQESERQRKEWEEEYERKQERKRLEREREKDWAKYCASYPGVGSEERPDWQREWDSRHGFIEDDSLCIVM